MGSKLATRAAIGEKRRLFGCFSPLGSAIGDLLTSAVTFSPLGRGEAIYAGYSEHDWLHRPLPATGSPAPPPSSVAAGGTGGRPPSPREMPVSQGGWRPPVTGPAARKPF